MPSHVDVPAPLIGFDQEDLIKLARWQMPFGKYAGRVLIDLPEAYLFWFNRTGFPDGKLGELMKLCLELKVEGLDSLLQPLKQSPKGPNTHQESE
jgi:hypothetical protein